MENINSMRKVLILSAISIGSALVGCGSQTNNSEATIAKEMMLKVLKDPDSAKFESLNGDGEGFSCGKVNAKNGFGGYNGFRKFFIHGRHPNEYVTFLENSNGKFVLLGIDKEISSGGNDLIDVLWDHYCGKKD